MRRAGGGEGKEEFARPGGGRVKEAAGLTRARGNAAASASPRPRAVVPSPLPVSCTPAARPRPPGGRRAPLRSARLGGAGAGAGGRRRGRRRGAGAPLSTELFGLDEAGRGVVSSRRLATGMGSLGLSGSVAWLRRTRIKERKSILFLGKQISRGTVGPLPVKTLVSKRLIHASRTRMHAPAALQHVEDVLAFQRQGMHDPG